MRTAARTESPLDKHRLWSALWRLAAAQIGRSTVPLDPLAASLAPRVRQTLDELLAGRSEKEIANQLGLSPHTVHVYVRTIYRRYRVSSRAELLSTFLAERSDVMLFRRAVEAAASEGPVARRAAHRQTRRRR